MREKNEKQTPGAEPIPPELVEQAKAGDQAAFTELYERTSTMLYRTIRSMVRDEDLVWDIQQDSYVRAWKGLSELQASEAFLPWLRRIAVNTALNALNKKVPLTFTELAGDGDEREPEIPDLNIETQPELALDRKETSRLVRELLAELSPEQQAIVGMHYYEDMPIGEIAKTLRVAPGTVKTLLFRGRKRIEAGVRALEKQGVKLYGLSPLPFLLALLGRLEPSAQAEKKTLAAVLEQAPAASGTAAVTVTAMTAGQAFLKGLGTKLLAGALALSLIAVGGKLAYDALADRKLPPIGIERPTAEETLTPSELVTPTKLYAPEDAPENACGPHLTWRFNRVTGTLTIKGSGEMYDYSQDVRTIPWHGFCRKITSVELQEGVTAIGDWTFEYCTGLTSVTIPEGVTTIGDGAFLGCSKLMSVTIPESVTSIGDNAFLGCSKLMSVTIPESVTTIGEYAFHRCSGLTSVTISKGVTTIGAGAFEYCSGLTSVTIPEGVTSIRDFAFEDCTGLTSVTIPEGVTSIGDSAFKDCTGLTSVTIPEGVTSIRDSAFSGCTGLKSVTIPDSVTFIGSRAFSYCTGLTSVTIPDSVTFIGQEAFFGCTALRAMTIPASVRTIYHGAFGDCPELTLRGAAGSEAEQYANENDIPFEAIP